MYRDLGFIRVAGRHTRRDTDRGRAQRLRLPGLPAQADRGLPARHRRLLSEYCVEFPDLSGGGGASAAARLGRRAGQVDGAHLRRGPRDPPRQHAPRGPAARPGARAPRPLAPRGVGAPPPAARRAAVGRRSERGPAQPQPGRSSRARPGPGARVPEGHRLRRRRAEAADRRHRQHLDRDDAVQLPPARAWRRRSRRACARPAARRWSSTRSRSPTASRWAPRA